MCLVGGNYRHSLKGACKRDFVCNGYPIIVLRDHLLIVRIWTLYQTGENRGEWRSEANVIVAACDLQLLLRWEQPSHLLQCFRRNDQVTRWRVSRVNRQIHLRQTMTIRRNHTHLVRPELPQNTVQDRSTLLSRNGERSVRD